MTHPIPIGEEKVIHQGHIIEIVQQDHQVGDRVIPFEKARRSPGVRMIIVKDGKMLLSKEYRTELGGDDYRLPGGKVFDKLEEYNEALKGEVDLVEVARGAVERECVEETGHACLSAKHIHTTSPGATISWDLYYFVVEEFEVNADGQQLEGGEVIEPMWFGLDEVKEMCLDGRVQEERTAAVLMRYLDGRL
mgnify:CR=1 FL=1